MYFLVLTTKSIFLSKFQITISDNYTLTLLLSVNLSITFTSFSSGAEEGKKPSWNSHSRLKLSQAFEKFLLADQLTVLFLQKQFWGLLTSPFSIAPITVYLLALFCDKFLQSSLSRNTCKQLFTTRHTYSVQTGHVKVWALHTLIFLTWVSKSLMSPVLHSS